MLVAEAKEEQVLTVSEAALFLKIHPETLRRAIKSGRLKALKIGKGKSGSYRLLKSELEKLFS